MTDELNQVILKLKDRISNSIHFQEGLNEASWNRQLGILITRNDANVIVSELEKPLPTDDEIEQYAIENELQSDSIAGFAEMQTWIEGAKWMRDQIRKEKS